MENKKIDPEDLIFVEEDLTKDELISLLFLLYGRDKPDWILEKLRSSTSKNFLRDFAYQNSNWKSLIAQALTIVRVFEVIENLGIKSSEAREHLSRKSTTNEGLKVLYQLCEACTKAASEKLINHIKTQIASARISQSNQLEVYLLHAIANKQIRIAQSLDACDFSFLSNFFTENKFEEVERVLSKFPKRPNSLDNVNNNSFGTVDLTTSNSNTKVDSYPSRALHVLIINQQKFYSDPNPELKALLPERSLDERAGTTKDKEALQQLFEGFGYQVTVKTNLIHLDILREVRNAVKRASTGEGLIVSILSHGHEGVVYGHNSIPVRIKDVKKLMATSVLLGKPKVLIIQACQGNSLQKEAVKRHFRQLEHDGVPETTYTTGSPYADFLTFWSTIEGFASVRHVDKGSWFIQELVNKIRELHNDQHLMDICTSVIYEVSQKRGYGNECMLPEFETTLMKKFRFPPLKSDSLC